MSDGDDYTPFWLDGPSLREYMLYLIASEQLTTEGEIVYFLHKPWKWREEYRTYKYGVSHA